MLYIHDLRNQTDFVLSCGYSCAGHTLILQGLVEGFWGHGASNMEIV